MLLLALLILTGLVTALACFAVWGGWSLFTHLWLLAGTDKPWRRIGVIFVGLALISSPYLIWKAYLYEVTLARLPAPLEVAKIEFQNEDAWGIGGPGDPETGFIAYRLKRWSAAWARRQGSNLSNVLPGGREEWKETPIICGVRCEWHGSAGGEMGPHGGPSLDGYLNKYGFGIRVDRKWVRGVEHAITTPGSVYRYGKGGSVTIVAPQQGMAYFAYAG